MKITVKAKNFFEFRALLNLCYDMGLHFYGGKKYSALHLWFCKGSSGIALGYPDNRIKYSTCEDEDWITVGEYMRILTGII